MGARKVDRPFEPGWVMTVEPAIYIPEENLGDCFISTRIRVRNVIFPWLLYVLIFESLSAEENHVS